jgi:cell division septation protein DedD
VEPATQPAPAISDAKPAEPAPSNRTKVAALRRDAATSRDDEAPAASAPWSVQLTSQKSESQARSALADIQKKHQALLSRHKPRIVKVELGSKGTYYRVQVGTASQEAANKLCSGLKAAGASCLVHRN